MPTIRKTPSDHEQAITALEQRETGLRSKLDTALARVKALERQRDNALRSAEDARSAVTPAPPKLPIRRKRLNSDRIRITFGDMHGHNHDPEAFAAMLADMKRFDPHEVIIGGDGINCGGFLAQHHVLGYVAETEETYEQDVVTTNGLLDAIQKHAPRARIEWVEGNHDARPEKWAVTETLRHSRDAEFLRRLISPETLLGLKARGIPYHRRSEYHDGMNIPGWIKRGKIFFVHELGSSEHAAAKAVRSTGGNVVYFHTHRQDYRPIVLPAVGLIAAWNPGCLCKRQPLWRHSNPTNWTHGYGVQFVTPSENFLHVNVLIENGQSLMGSLLG